MDTWKHSIWSVRFTDTSSGSFLLSRCIRNTETASLLKLFQQHRTLKVTRVRRYVHDGKTRHRSSAAASTTSMYVHNNKMEYSARSTLLLNVYWPPRPRPWPRPQITKSSLLDNLLTNVNDHLIQQQQTLLYKFEMKDHFPAPKND